MPAAEKLAGCGLHTVDPAMGKLGKPFDKFSATLLGGLGGAIGGLLFWVAKDKGKSVQYVVLGLLLVGLIAAMVFAANGG